MTKKIIEKINIEKGLRFELYLMLLLLALIFACYIPGMNGMAYMTIHLGMTVLFAFFAFFIWRKKGEDEREELHKAIASEAAFIAGGITILGTIAYRSIMEMTIDTYLFNILFVMVLTRFILRIYFNKTR